MEKVSWKDKKTNEAIMVSVGEERCFVQTVMKRKKNLDWPCCTREQFVKACNRRKDGG